MQVGDIKTDSRGRKWRLFRLHATYSAVAMTTRELAGLGEVETEDFYTDIDDFPGGMKFAVWRRDDLGPPRLKQLFRLSTK